MFAHIARAYPQAPVYTALFDPRQTGDLVEAARVRTSGLQRLPAVERYFRYLAPLYPAAFERFDLSGYDVIVSSTTSWAKGVIFPPSAVHISYVNTVSRFAFDFDNYVGGLAGNLREVARPFVRQLAEWDRKAAQRPTALVANSQNVAERIRRYYARDAYVLHCPVDVSRYSVGPGGGNYAVTVARLLPYKRVDVAIDACALAGIPLHVVGTGPAEAQLRHAARDTQTTFHGTLSDADLNELVGRARVVLVPGEEDFGLVPLEANAAGRPVIAFGRGGARETVLPGVTGELLEAQTPVALAAALAAHDPRRYEPARLREHAETFAPARFIEKLCAIVDEVAAKGGVTASR